MARSATTPSARCRARRRGETRGEPALANRPGEPVDRWGTKWPLRIPGKRPYGGGTAMAKVIITLTCDWDALDYAYTDRAGKSCTPPDRFNGGVGAITRFHELFGGAIPITHFICPAYFARKSPNESKYADGIKALAKAGDEIALHIHCWKSLVEACGVTFLD